MENAFARLEHICQEQDSLYGGLRNQHEEFLSRERLRCGLIMARACLEIYHLCWGSPICSQWLYFKRGCQRMEATFANIVFLCLFPFPTQRKVSWLIAVVVLRRESSRKRIIMMREYIQSGREMDVMQAMQETATTSMVEDKVETETVPQQPTFMYV